MTSDCGAAACGRPERRAVRARGDVRPGGPAGHGRAVRPRPASPCAHRPVGCPGPPCASTTSPSSREESCRAPFNPRHRRPLDAVRRHPDVSPGLGQDGMHPVGRAHRRFTHGPGQALGGPSLGPVRSGWSPATGCWPAPRSSPPRERTGPPGHRAVRLRAVVPRAAGMSGDHRSRRSGEGGELAGVRPFRPGTGCAASTGGPPCAPGAVRRLHPVRPRRRGGAAAGRAVRGGRRRGPASVLDTTVRVAAAIAEHYTRRVTGCPWPSTGPASAAAPGTGRRHHLAQLAWLADTRAMPEGWDALGDRPPIAGPPASNALVIMLTPLLDPRSATALATFGPHPPLPGRGRHPARRSPPPESRRMVGSGRAALAAGTREHHRPPA